MDRQMYRWTAAWLDSGNPNWNKQHVLQRLVEFRLWQNTCPVQHVEHLPGPEHLSCIMLTVIFQSQHLTDAITDTKIHEFCSSAASRTTLLDRGGNHRINPRFHHMPVEGICD